MFAYVLVWIGLFWVSLTFNIMSYGHHSLLSSMLFALVLTGSIASILRLIWFVADEIQKWLSSRRIKKYGNPISFF